MRSTVMYDSIDEYLKIIDQMQKQGFSAVKFHTWCIPKKDLELAKEARDAFPEMSFMLDAENNYNLRRLNFCSKKIRKVKFYLV